MSNQGLPLTAKLLTHEELLSVSGQIECEAPNIHLYEFIGNIRLVARQSVVPLFAVDYLLNLSLYLYLCV